VKFTERGEVKVKAERASEDQVRISVSDTGIGISESDIPKIFEEFRQVGGGRGARTGTGLGLAITERLVKLLGGEITVSSRVGEGTTFAVTLPVEIEGRIADAVIEAPIADPDRTALVIDSDPASLFLTKKYLTEAGYSVAATDDAARGAEIAEKAEPSVVMLDLDLVEDGVDLIRRIAGEGAGRRKPRAVVAMSGDAGLEQQSIEAGAVLFLRKPVDKDELIRSVEQARAASRATVLVVDDDPDALDLVVAMLEGNDYEIRTATSGREAMDQVARERPDAIVLDLMLPEMDGFEVVHRLSMNDEWRAIPVILLTARDLSHEEKRALDIGAARIIQKGSFSRDELLAELAVLLDAEARSAQA
jgi:CheY-like chemotaxis protein